MYVNPSLSSGILHILCRHPILLAVVVISLGVGMFWPGSEVPAECTPEGLVSFVFDDGYESTFTKAFPILEENGFPGMVYVITDSIGEPNYMTAEQLKVLYEHGWEIGSHTVRHPDLTKLPKTMIDYELSKSKERLEAMGFVVQSFASPYGKYNDDVIEIAGKYYASHRTAWPKDINQLPLEKGERYELKSVYVDSETTVEELENWVTRAKEEKSWLILLFHRIDEEGEWNWNSSDLRKIVEFTRKQGFDGLKIEL